MDRVQEYKHRKKSRSTGISRCARALLDFDSRLCDAPVAARATPMPHVVHNEQIKLFAGMLDRVGTVCFAVGVATPISAFVVGAPLLPVRDFTWLVGSGVVWTAMFIALHWTAQAVLKDLRE
jgi:hypothetical protein